ncbi:MAG: AAA family ATPase, partial [Pseudomonadota bacterium]
SSGQAELFMVGGFSGIGKTALVREIKAPVTLKRGLFIGGKFDPYRRDVPFSGVAQALKHLVNLILSDSDVEQDWQQCIAGALGSHGRVLQDMLPEITQLIGPQPDLPEMTQAEAQSLTTRVLVDFVRTVASTGRPLVIFLDDLQWVDAASINLLNALMAAPDMGHLLLVTAFRSNEIDGAHRFTQFREDTAARRGEIPSIDLPPLSVESVAEMLGDAMGCSRARVGDLAALARQATAGNPFFLQQFLTQLSRDHLLRFDADQKAWTWDLQEISAQNLVDNVADLMASEIGRADCHTRAALEIAACMGTRFELRALAKISGLTVQQIADRMWPAFENGWVLPIGRQHRLMRLSRYAIPNDLTIDCRFSHDRVHQAVYDRIVPAERAANHWQIGQGLLEGLDDSVDGNLVLHIASHLNLGGDEVSRAENRQDLQKVNLAAGQRAKTVGAHAASLEYFENGLSLRRAGDWQDQPGLVRLLLQGGAEAAYLNGDPEKTTLWTQELLDNAETTTDRTIALEIRIRSTLLTEGQQAAVSLGLEALKELGVALPTMPARSDMDAAIEAVERAVGGRDVASLSDLPLMTDPGDLATMRLFHSMLSATYASSPDLFVVLTSRMVELSIERGLSSMSIVAFADFAIVLCGRRDEFELGYAYGRLSLGLIEKLSARDVEARVTFMFYSFVHHWTEHLSGAFAPLRDAFQTGMDTGDAQYAAMSAFDYGFNLFWLGGPLAHADKEMLRFDEGILSTGQDWIRMLHLMYRQAVASLTSTSRVDASLSGEHLDAEAMIPKLEASKSSNALVQIRILRLMLNYLFGSYRVAVREAQAARDHLSGVAATAAIPGYHFYAVLAELAAAQDGAVAIKAEHLVTSRALLKLWAERSPANYRHKHLLVEAEIAGIEGRFNDARDLYDQAIDLARENGFLLEEALACERAGRFYLTNGRKRQARHYLADAHDNWQHCGAHAKVRSLETEIDQLLERTGANLSQSGRGLTTTELDFSSVLRATQAISSEIVLPKLLQTLMTALIENAGATRGVLVLRTATDWEIAADGRAEAQIVTVRATDDDRADRDADGAPLSVVEAVSQTREDLIVHDARDHDLLMADPYAQRVQPKAVLFYPIEMQSSVIGVLYLENSLMTGAFSKQRLEVLKPLCAQAAISIENAKLHKHQVNLTESANRFVPSRLANVLGRESLADVQLGDHAERDMALAVTDIRGFTSIAENLSPQEVFEFVNAYVQATDPALRENNGIVVKYMGDSQMAVFPDKAEDAMAAAIAVCRRLDEFNAGQRGADRPPISIGIGLHVGYTMLGIVGEAQRCQLDILSDSVNLVARIEKLTRTFGSNTLLSDAVLARLRADHDFETRYLGRAQIKGRRDAVGLHELIDAEAPEQQFLRTATRPVFEAAVTSMFDEDLP